MHADIFVNIVADSHFYMGIHQLLSIVRLKSVKHKVKVALEFANRYTKIQRVIRLFCDVILLAGPPNCLSKLNYKMQGGGGGGGSARKRRAISLARIRMQTASLGSWARYCSVSLLEIPSLSTLRAWLTGGGGGMMTPSRRQTPPPHFSSIPS